jgi:23S rRNA pseudouridine1911/1915/1917 synthase
VHGGFDFAHHVGEINAPIGRMPRNRMRFGVLEKGRSAITKYKVIRSNKDYSLLELYPVTGRTHQLRVHLKYINHPIVGDYLYAGRKLYREDEKKFGRLMLHAKKIVFIHPVTKKETTIEAPLPDGLKLL